MAVAKMGAMITALKGKIGGTIFQGSRAGQVVKNNSNPYNPSGKLTKADAGRNLMAITEALVEQSTRWKNLTDAQRAGWTSAAANFQFLDKYGNLYTGSGFQVFMSINVRLAQVNLTTLDDAPAPGTITNSPAFTVSYNGAAGQFEVAAFTMVAGFTYYIAATRGLSKGRMPKPSDFVEIYVFDPAEVFPFNLGNYFADQFGPPPSSGNFWFRLTCINNNTGQKGVMSYYQLTY